MPTILDTAVAASKAGIVVVPVKEDGSKQPDLPAWTHLQERQPTKDELTEWFVKRERSGLGFICGLVSGGLELLEFDDPGAYQEFKAACVEEGLWPVLKQLEAGYCETTPGGGVHLLYRTPEPLKNTKLAQQPCPGAPDCSKHDKGKPHVLAETRGEGGFVVVAPSHGKVHPSGGEYVQRGNGIAALPDLDVDTRDHLFLVVQSLDAMPRPQAEPQPRIRSEASGDRPGDDFNARADWMQDVLGPHGWKAVKRYGGLTYVRRPGKDSSHSATFGRRGDGDYLYVFSSATEFDPERGYSKFAAFTLLNHGTSDADFSTAARELRKQGYGGEYDDISTLVAGGALPQAGEMVAAAPSAASAVDVSYEFKSIFPSDHFVGRYIAWAASRTDSPHEYHEALAVMLLAALTPGIRAPLSAWPGGLPTNLYVVLVGSSSRARKSTAIKLLREVLDRVDEQAVFPDRFSAEAMLEQLSYRPMAPALWLPDEWGQMVEELERNPKQRDALLTLYDGPRVYDYARHSKRVKGGEQVRDHDRIQDPHWNVVGATTESVFDVLSSRAIESGFLPRFAYIFPTTYPPRMGLRVNNSTMQGGADDLVAYARNLSTWATVAKGMTLVDFPQNTVDILDVYQKETDERSEHDLILARLPAMSVKVAMLSALGDEVPRNTRFEVRPIDAERGVALARRWGQWALKFAGDVGGFDAQERRHERRAQKGLTFTRGGPGGSRGRADVMRHLHVGAREMDEIERTLVERGELLVTRTDETGGRPKRTWTAVH